MKWLRLSLQVSLTKPKQRLGKLQLPHNGCASQLLDPIGHAWRTKANVKAALLGDEDPDEWDLPPKPRGMRWATYERWVARYDAAEELLDAQLVMAAARLMRRL